ncbi:MAG: hypothetical protein Q8Q89_02945 [bacterium]|nr:hypothetical protein [bacterium]
MKLKFIEDIEKDAQNWHSSLDAKVYGMDWVKFLPKDISAEKIKDINYLKDYLDKKYYKTGKISEFKTWLGQNVNSAEIQKDLELLMVRKFDDETISVSITVFGRGMYNVPGNFFYINFCHSNPEKSISRIYHELMHFLFHIYYWDKCKKAGLSEPQIHNLKESLTMLLNPILEKHGLPLDMGYPKHQELRDKLKKLWEEEENFEPFLKKVLKLKLVIG